MAWCWNLPPFWSMKSGQTLKVMVVTRTCLPPLAPMAAFSAARVGFHQRFLAVSPSSWFCLKPVQRSLSRSLPRDFLPASIIPVLIWNRGIFWQLVSMRNKEVFDTEHVVLVSLTAVPSKSSFQKDPSLENKTINKRKAALNKERYLWSADRLLKLKVSSSGLSLPQHQTDEAKCMQILMNHVLTFPRQYTSIHSAQQQMLHCCWLSPFHWRIHWWIAAFRCH